MKQQTQQLTEINRLRSELIHSRGQVMELQEELKEKTNLYINAISERNQFKERLNNAKESINRVDNIVESKVNLALEKERALYSKAKEENQLFKQRIDMMDQEREQMAEREKALMDKVQGLTQDLAFYARNVDARESMKRIEALRDEKDQKERTIIKLTQDLNDLSNKIDDFMAENSVLRKMANVPKNYGINREQVKLHDREKIDDYKKLIRVLQDDNYKLEEERARLKHMLKQQSMMYKQDPSQRYKDLTQEQIFKVDQFVLKLKAGETEEPADFYKLKKENQNLKAQLEALNSKGFDFVRAQLELFFKDKGFSDSNQMIQQLLSGNESIINLIKNIKVSPGEGSSSTTNVTINGNTGAYRPPMPMAGFDGDVSQGFSYKFKTHFDVVDKNGKPGIGETNRMDTAFLQLQLVELFEIIKRKDENLSAQEKQIDVLYKRVRDYLLIQDQLYKDYVSLEKQALDKQQKSDQALRNSNDRLLEEQIKLKNLEDLLRALNKSDKASIEHRLIELTKQNSLLDINLLRTSRRLQTLEEQEQILRREYHNQEAEMSEKDRFVQARINSLKEWKARAIQQLKFLFQKLRFAVPISEYQSLEMDLDIFKQKNDDFIDRNARMAQRMSKLQTQVRENLEAQEKLRVLQEAKDEIENEFEVISKRLEQIDQNYRWEVAIFNKVVAVLKRVKVSPQQAFEEFDQNHDGKLTRTEFNRGLEMMKISDLSNQEIDILIGSLDTDSDGYVNYKEFIKKLARHGIRSRTTEEQIIHLIVEGLQRSRVKNLSEAFELIDKEGRGIISRDDFKDIFKSLNVKIDASDIDKFIDSFWKDKAGGIDYMQFLRIFNRYQIKFEESANAKQGVHVRIPDAIIRLKKRFFGELDKAFKQTGKNIKSLFQSIDVDGSNEVDLEEFRAMFTKMNLKLPPEESEQIFNSIDFDLSGKVSFPELVADFEHCIKTEMDTLLREEKEKAADAVSSDNRATYQKKQSEQKINEDILKGMPTMTAQNMESQYKTRIAILEAREKQQARNYETSTRILRLTEASHNEVQTNYNLLEKKWNEMIEQYHIQRETIRDLEEKIRRSVDKDEAERIKIKNETLKTKLTETEAGMISYKNMTEVISDQVKALKLTLERKKDENENLVGAIRELQSMSVDQQRLGKLYYIVMLSRWQEAAVNKKYDLVLTENKELRKELLNIEQLYKGKEYEYHESENQLQTRQLEIEKLKQVLSSTKSFFLTLEKAEELNRIIHEISDEKTELEEYYFKLRSEYLSTQLRMDEAVSKADHANDLLEVLQKSKQSELSDKLIEISQKLQGVRLKELRATRENGEMKEKNNYVSKLLKLNIDQIKKLEEQVSDYESKMHKKEEEFRRADNERMKKFFNARFDDIPGALGKTDPYDPKPGFGQHLKSQPSFVSQSHSALETINRDVQANNNFEASDVRMLEGQVKRLKEELKQAIDQIKSMDSIINRFKEWQLADQYLAQDEQLRDAIDSHKVKRDQLHEQESKEMAEAAYTTIKTLQEMLDQKNIQLRHKEELIAKYTHQMAQQREQDGMEISRLQQQATLTAGTTLSKLQQIVARDDSSQGVQGPNYGRKYDRLTKEELQKTLEEKDHHIQQLNSQVKAVHDEKQMALHKKQDALDRVLDLEVALNHAEQQTELKASRKELDRVKRELREKEQKNADLKRAIDELGDRMTKYEIQKSHLTEDDKMRKIQDHTKDGEYKRQVDEMKQKLKLMETQRNQRAEDLKQMKIKEQEKAESEKKITVERDDARKALALTNERLQTEMKNRQSLQIEVNTMRSAHQIGKDVHVGGPSVEQLLVRNKELENDILILQCQQKTVVVYNKETATFEYIGETIYLQNPNPASQQQQDITEIEVFLQQLEIWLNKNPRLTIHSIFEAQDKHNFGELTENQFEIALNKIGIKLRPKEKQMLKELLDPKNIGYLRYRPLVSHISGVPQIDFMQREILKIAKLVEARDLNLDMLKMLIDPKKQENMSFAEFQEACKALKSDNFILTDQEQENIFKYITKTIRTTGVSISITKLSIQVFVSFKALLIEHMRSSILKTMKPLSELFQKYDTNKDGFLEYSQLESLFLDVSLAFKPQTLKLIFDLLDEKNRHSKISYQSLKFFVSEGSSFKSLISDMGVSKINQGSYGADVPTMEGGVRISEETTNEELNYCRQGARKILSAMQGTLLDLLTKRDIYHEGIVGREDLEQIIKEQKVQELTQGEMQLLLKQTDRGHKGYLSIQHFVEKLHELAAETRHDVMLRRFGNTIKHQGINLRAEFNKYETGKGTNIDKKQFQRCLRGLSIALTDEEIELLFQTSEIIEQRGWLDIKYFINRVTVMQKQKPLPTFIAQQPNMLAQGKTQTGKDKSGGVFENWEAEKKYKKKLEALQQQIEESKKETQAAEKQSKHWQEMANRLEREKNALQTRLVDFNAKPPKAAMYESLGQGQIEEMQKLKDQVFYLQDLNMKLEKNLQVDLKHEISKLNKEKDKFEEKTKSQAEQIRRLEYQVSRLIGKPPADKIEQREEEELWRENKIKELEKELEEREKNEQHITEQLFKSDENVLDLKFQKETFDLQYARLQKRITDLEQYKLASSKYSAVLKRNDDEEKRKIDEIQMNGLGVGNSMNKKDQDTIKLKSRSSKSVVELETLVEALKRVIEKQKTEIEGLNKKLAEKETEGEKIKSQKNLRQKIEHLEMEVHSHELKEINLDGKDKTIKKVLESNKMMRDDLKMEGERYIVLEKKYKEILIKYNVLAKEHAANVERLFAQNTGGHLKNYDKYLERNDEQINNEDERYYQNHGMKNKNGSGKQSRGHSLERQFEDVF